MKSQERRNEEVQTMVFVRMSPRDAAHTKMVAETTE